MNNATFALIVFIACFGIWCYSAFPVLRYAVDASEGRFKWIMVVWLFILLFAIQGMKYTLSYLSGWPEPGTWNWHLFLAYALALTYSIPFIWTYIRHIFKK